MPTFNQLVRKGREDVEKKAKAPALLNIFFMRSPCKFLTEINSDDFNGNTYLPFVPLISGVSFL